MTGTVTELSGGKVLVRPEGCGDCFGCVTNCGGERLVTVENRGGLPLAGGQRVEIRSPAPLLLAQTLTVLLPLPAAFAAGFVIAGLFEPGEAVQTLAGLLGCLAAGALVYLVRRRFPAKAFPRVSRILPDSLP